MKDTKTILVVEDDREMLDGLCTVLEQKGYRAVSATNGIQAKQCIDRQHPDVVVLDMMMPRLGGYPVLEYFAGKENAPPFIMITANEGKRHKAYAEFLGVVDYLRKPFAIDYLLESIEKALELPKSV